MRMNRRRLLGGAALVPLARGLRAWAHAPDTQAIAEVAAGKRNEANAAWWGFQADDSTAALQAAIDSRARTVVVPFLGSPWIIRPVTLRGGQEILFEPGVLVLAKKGEFHGKNDSLFTATEAAGLTLRGYGATLRMRKPDYQSSAYAKAEWRMGIALHGCSRVLIEGLRVESTGGDGFYVDGGPRSGWSEDITIRHCVADDNHRQGLSVISAVNLLVEDCTFSNTRGTAPEAGIDLEPDTPRQRLANCVIRNCVFENNHGHGMLVHLHPLNGTSAPVSVHFENCLARMGHRAGEAPEEAGRRDAGGSAGMAVGAAVDGGPRGLVEFVNCHSENTGREGAKVYDKSADSVLVRFARCSWRNTWTAAAADYGGPRVPVYLVSRRPEITRRYGGVEFADCRVYDRVARPALQAYEETSHFGVRDVHGRIVVDNPAGARARLGPHPQNADVQVVPAER